MSGPFALPTLARLEDALSLFEWKFEVNFEALVDQFEGTSMWFFDDFAFLFSYLGGFLEQN